MSINNITDTKSSEVKVFEHLKKILRYNEQNQSFNSVMLSGKSSHHANITYSQRKQNARLQEKWIEQEKKKSQINT